MTQEQTLRVFRGDKQTGGLKDYQVPVTEGMVVLDALHWIQAHQAGDLAVRWNCKAAKCGSCSVEINGIPALACKTRMDKFEGVIQVRPMKAFPLLRDLVTDVSWNYARAKAIPPFTPSKEDASTKEPWTVKQEDIDRVYEMRKCIECFLCQDTCHVLRDHKKNDFIGPAMLVRAAGYDMHPKDTINRAEFLKNDGAIGLCNITKCCTEVCPEHIHITDNAIIPLKERVVTEFYDPVKWLWRKLTGKKRAAHPPVPQG